MMGAPGALGVCAVIYPLWPARCGRVWGWFRVPDRLLIIIPTASFEFLACQTRQGFHWLRVFPGQVVRLSCAFLDSSIWPAGWGRACENE